MFSLVWSTDGDSTIYVILSKRIWVPAFDCATGSGTGYLKPIDFKNPNEWGYEYPAYVMYNTLTGKDELKPAEKFKQYKNENGIPHAWDQYTSQMRRLLGLSKIGNS